MIKKKNITIVQQCLKFELYWINDLISRFMMKIYEYIIINFF